METYTPGDNIQSPFWQEIVQVVSIQPHDGYDVITVNSIDGGTSRRYVLTPEDLEKVQRFSQSDYRQVDFNGNPEQFRMGIQAHRLRMARDSSSYY